MKKVMATIAAALLGVLAAQAADPTFAYSGAGCRTLIVDGGGAVISNRSVTVDAGAVVPWKLEVIQATKTASAETTEFVATNYVGILSAAVTNWYAVATDSVEVENVTGIALTNITVSSTVTNKFDSIDNVDTNTWRVVGKDGAKFVCVKTGEATSVWAVPVKTLAEVPSGWAVTGVVETATATNTFTSLKGVDLSKWEIVTTNGYTRTVSAGSQVAAGGTLAVTDGDGTSWGTLTISGGASSSTNVFDAAKIAFGGSLRLTATDAERLKLKVYYVRLGR